MKIINIESYLSKKMKHFNLKILFYIKQKFDTIKIFIIFQVYIHYSVYMLLFIIIFHILYIKSF